MIKTRPCGKAEQHNNLALFALTRLKMMYHAKRFIASATSIYEPIFTRYFLQLAHNISLTETLCHAT